MDKNNLQILIRVDIFCHFFSCIHLNDFFRSTYPILRHAQKIPSEDPSAVALLFILHIRRVIRSAALEVQVRCVHILKETL